MKERWLFLGVLILALGCGGSQKEGQGVKEVSEGSGSFESDAPPGEPSGKAEGEGLEEGQEVVEEVEEEEEGLPELSVDHMEPVTGSSAGGEKVEIWGTGFTPQTQVLFGGVPAKKVGLVKKGVLEVTTPPHPPEKVDVTLIREDHAMLVLPKAFTFYAEVVVESCEPAVVPAEGGTRVVVRGHGFEHLKAIWVGGVRAIGAHELGEDSAEFVTPVGTPGTKDVVVVTESGLGVGVGVLRYVERPEVDFVEPPSGPVSGGNEVTLQGKGLGIVSRVLFGDAEARIIAQEDSKIEVEVPPGDEGPVDITWESALGEGILVQGYRYVGEEERDEVYGVFPSRGDAKGGNEAVVVIGWDPQSPEVFFGASKANLVASHKGYVKILVPPGSPGFVDVRVKDQGHDGVLKDGYLYVRTLEVTNLYPHSGPTQGGTRVHIQGSGLSEGCRVRFGGRKAQCSFDKEVVCSTPQHPAGTVSVAVECDGTSKVLGGAFTYVEHPIVEGIVPMQGATSGGTFVRMFGLGLVKPKKVLFGKMPASHVKLITEDLVVMKSPRGKEGVVDVTAEFPDGTVQTLKRAFMYYEPVAGQGGTWGGPSEGTVNVVVLDGGSGRGLPDTYVIVGSDPSTPYQGYTDERGRISFAGPDLDPPITVNANKECYTNGSVVDFDAKNVTIILQNICEQGGGMPPGMPVAVLKGKLWGLGKYVLPPVANCNKLGTASDGVNCKPCFFDSECGPNGKCQKMGHYGTFCATVCKRPSDCPEGYNCAQVGPQELRCIPIGGEKVARCSATIPDPYTKNPFQPVEVHEGEEFEVQAIPGERALVCIGGTYDPELDIFTPIAMGVRRGIIASPNAQIEGLDVRLDIPLKRKLKFRLDHPPLRPSGPDLLAALIFYDFGNEGVFQSPELPYAFSDEVIAAYHQPLSLSGPLDGVKYIIMAGAFTLSGNSTPASIVQVRDLKDLEDDVYYRFDGDRWYAGRGAPTKEIYGAWRSPDGNVWLVGEKGAVYVYDGADFMPQQVPAFVDLYGVWGSSEQDIWIVGSQGVVLHFDGSTWKEVEVPGMSRLYNLFTVGGTGPQDIYIGGNFALFHYNGSTWKKVSSAPYVTVVRCYEGTCYAGARFGKLALLNGDSSQRVNTGFHEDIYTITRLGDALVLGGEKGFVALFDGENTKMLSRVTDQTLRASVTVGRKAYLLGENGAIVMVTDGGKVHPLFVDKLKPDLWAAVTVGDKEAIALGVSHLFFGPLLDPVIPVYPKNGDKMRELKLDFDFKDSPQASVMYIDIAIPGLFGDQTIWTLLADGQTHHIELPPFEEIEGTMDIPSGGVYKITVERILIPQGTVNDFDYLKLHPMYQRAWAVTQWSFTR